MTRTRTSYDKGDSRRDKRYPLPSLVVVLFGQEYETKDWSLGGLRLSGLPKSLKVGDEFYGEFRVEGGEERASFRGDVVRLDTKSREFAIRFLELGLHAIELLDGALARRFFRRKA
jgi:PilZ domain-containing protein